MVTFHESMQEYRRLLEKGTIQQAYRGLMEFFMDLRTHLKNKYPAYVISGGIYPGTMDMTYFSFSPQSLKDMGLKVAIVFVHERFRFEVWLAGVNKQVQTQYWKLIKDSDWKQYNLVSTTVGADSILEDVLTDNPDFRDLAALTQQIETGTLKFIEDIERFLSQY